MLKAARPGAVTTRLGKDLGFETAAAIYRQLVERQVSQLPKGWAVEIHFDPPEAEAEMRAWLGASFLYRPQTQGDLGVRLRHAANLVFEAGAHGLIFLGGDCPSITSELLEECAAKMNGHDAVIGPALDGGYYLIATRQFQPTLFENIEWSTPRVLEQTLARLQDGALSHFLLPEFEDVDDVGSWERAKSHCDLQRA